MRCDGGGLSARLVAVSASTSPVARHFSRHLKKARMTKAKTRPQRTNDPAGTRSRILDAAADLFQAKGYHDSSMHDIIRAAGVTSGALHHHFASKKELGLAVVKDRVWDAVRESWIDPVRNAETPVQGIEAAFQAIGQGLLAQGFVQGCPLNNLAIELGYADPEFRDALLVIFAEWRDAIAARFRVSKAMQLTDLGADDLATLVVATYSGAMALSKAEQSPEPLQTAWRALNGFLRERETREPG